MFSSCLRTTRGSDLKKDKSKGHGGAWRYLVLSCLQCFWPFGQKETDLTQDSQTQDHADKVTSLNSQFTTVLLCVFDTVMIEENL